MIATQILQTQAADLTKPMPFSTKVCRELLKARRTIATLNASLKERLSEGNAASIAISDLRKQVDILDSALLATKHQLLRMPLDEKLFYIQAVDAAVDETEFWKKRALATEELAYNRLTIINDLLANKQ